MVNKAVQCAVIFGSALDLISESKIDREWILPFRGEHSSGRSP